MIVVTNVTYLYYCNQYGNMADLIQIKIKRSDYDRLVKFGFAGEPVHEAETRALDKAEGKNNA